jgi:cell fate (sporulation/competence/biofilm development) regulator YlbF (YheA/YmcA/DUF963 family)
MSTHSVNDATRELASLLSRLEVALAFLEKSDQLGDLSYASARATALRAMQDAGDAVQLMGAVLGGAQKPIRH